MDKKPLAAAHYVLMVYPKQWFSEFCDCRYRLNSTVETESMITLRRAASIVQARARLAVILHESGYKDTYWRSFEFDGLHEHIYIDICAGILTYDSTAVNWGWPTDLVLMKELNLEQGTGFDCCYYV